MRYFFVNLLDCLQKIGVDILLEQGVSNLMESMSISGEDSRFQTPRRPYLKMEQSFVKLELQDTGESQGKRDPTEKELCEIIIMIKDNLPDCHLGRVIQMLNDTLIYNEQEAKKEKTKSLRLLQEDDYLSDDEQHITQLEKKRMQQEFARKFENSDANPRFYEEREIAKLFCLKGYGYPTAREYLGDNITPNRYNNVITTIVRLSYRKLEYFIVKYINPRLATISREQLKMIKTPLVNCRAWMTVRQADNFHRFVKLTYKIPTEDPEKEVAMDLLLAIMDQLKKRNVTYKHHRRGEEHAGWTEEMEQNLIIHYLKNVTVQELQRELMLQHPASRPAFQIGRLKLKIDRLIRFSVRKINADLEKYGITQYTPIADFFTNKIIRAANAEQVRRRLLSTYLDRDRNAVKARWVFEAVREYMEKSRQEVEQIEDSSCEVIPKQELKAEQPLIIVLSKGPKQEQLKQGGRKKEEESESMEEY